jgi:hypothetical protein
MPVHSRRLVTWKDTKPQSLQALQECVGLNRQKHHRSNSTYVDLILRGARLHRSNSKYVDPILRGARLRRSDSTYVDPILRNARLRRSVSTYVDLILHARLGITRIQNRTRGAKNKVNSEQ